MVWRRSGDKSLSESMMDNLLTHICVTRPQWVIGDIVQQLDRANNRKNRNCWPFLLGIFRWLPPQRANNVVRHSATITYFGICIWNAILNRLPDFPVTTRLVKYCAFRWGSEFVLALVILRIFFRFTSSALRQCFVTSEATLTNMGEWFTRIRQELFKPKQKTKHTWFVPCLMSTRLFVQQIVRLAINAHQSSALLGLRGGNHPSPVGSPKKDQKCGKRSMSWRHREEKLIICRREDLPFHSWNQRHQLSASERASRRRHAASWRQRQLEMASKRSRAELPGWMEWTSLHVWSFVIYNFTCVV